ncbi:hypothetical protein QUF99_16500 [Bacillus sp. DX4.1]|uniref:hypothetical protein n=1 Tax=Bacillus sp. DX4.1 TaxID=3055867 RepID=UPI0025A2A904|nr:hypothetical protein [Bacillus sp. DX4.1]MDM5188857.1 hypothetical protein [Bacillus sp. DX4.1]
MEKTTGNQVFHVCIKTVWACIIAFSVTILLVNFMVGDQIGLKSLNKDLGSLGEYGSIAAATLWFLRHTWLYVHKNKRIGSKYLKELYMVLKKYHTFIGYAVLAVTTTHGIYFFIKGSHPIIRIYSGIFTFVCLLLLAVAGILLQMFKSQKKSVSYRKIHQMIAILFGLGLIIHLMV